MIKFSKGNSYLGRGVWSFNLPSGYTCPYALKCLAYTDRETGKLTKGESMEYKCYSAAGERYPNVRKLVWSNYESLVGKTVDEMAELILSAIPKKAEQIRIHAGGDFFSMDYFLAWLQVARDRKDIKFWAFTKSLPFWVKHKDSIPDNLVMIASYGGYRDNLIEKHGLKSALVVDTAEQADSMGLPIDDSDMIATVYNCEYLQYFANNLLIAISVNRLVNKTYTLVNKCRHFAAFK